MLNAADIEIAFKKNASAYSCAPIENDALDENGSDKVSGTLIVLCTIIITGNLSFGNFEGVNSFIAQSLHAGGGRSELWPPEHDNHLFDIQLIYRIASNRRQAGHRF